MTLVVQKFKTFIEKRKLRFRRRNITKGEPSKEKEKKKEKEKDQPIYYECNKPGYFNLDCPTLKKYFKRSKKKTMVATWSGSEDSSSNKEEEKSTNLCLMALENDVIFETNLEFTFDELHNAFHNFLAKFKKLGLTNKSFKQANDFLTTETDEVLQRNKALEKLKDEVFHLNNVLI